MLSKLAAEEAESPSSSLSCEGGGGGGGGGQVQEEGPVQGEMMMIVLYPLKQT